MRLLRTDTYELVERQGELVPPYAILSHVWGDDEVSFQDVQDGCARHRKGYAKLLGACTQAARDELDYIWIDTCCIDKSSSAELSEAINSMFQWYTQAEMCYVYMFDVVSLGNGRGILNFDSSQWFKRGWTLQELLAPPLVYFFNTEWQPLGSRQQLRRRIAGITKVPEEYFRTGDLTRYRAAQKMSWAAHRRTTRVEDMAYCLFGLFDVNMPLLYGEGSRAFRRLQEEILRRTEDDSLFAHTDTCHVLAPSPAAFSECHDIEKGDTEAYRAHQSFVLNRGLSITSTRIEMGFLLLEVSPRNYTAALNCSTNGMMRTLWLYEKSPGLFVKSKSMADPVAEYTLWDAQPRIVMLERDDAGNPDPWRWKSQNQAMTRNKSGQRRAGGRGPSLHVLDLRLPGLDWSNSDSRDGFRDNLIVNFPSRCAFGFYLESVHPGNFFGWHRRSGPSDKELYFYSRPGTIPARSWFLFRNDAGRAFLVAVEPSRASVNPRLLTNVVRKDGSKVHLSDTYADLLDSQEAPPREDEEEPLVAIQELEHQMSVEVHLSYRKRGANWSVTISFENARQGSLPLPIR